MTRVGLLLKLSDAFRCTDAGNWDPKEHPKGKHGLFVKKNSGAKRRQKTRPIKLSRKEYAKVMHNLNTHLSDEEKQKDALQKCIGNYLYIIQNNGFNNYVILGRIKLK